MRSYLCSAFRKFIFCLVGISLHVVESRAQFNFYRYSAGISEGIAVPYADTKKVNYSFATQASFDYYFTPYVTAGAEIQGGNMRGGIYGVQNFSNDFVMVAINAKLQAAQFFTRFDRASKFAYFLSGFYMGGGFGIMNNDIIGTRNGEPVITKTDDLNLIFNCGYNYFLGGQAYNRWMLNFNFQGMYGMADEMDGNLNPSSNFNDVYTYTSLGIRYKFGAIALDKRKSRYR